MTTQATTTTPVRTSRVGKRPVTFPKGVTVSIEGTSLQVKGPKGTLKVAQPAGVSVSIDGANVSIQPASLANDAMAGTLRALLANCVTGVATGYERKLELVGVGYRAAMAGSDLNLTLGFSHAVVVDIPEGITIEAPTQTEIVIKGADKQVVGQAAAKIRAFRSPEPYKGKGVRYAGERVRRKVGKAGK